MTRLTPSEVRALWAYAHTGNRQEAADLAGHGLPTLDKHLTIAYRVLDVPDVWGAMRRLGWLRPPLSLEDALADATHALGPVSPVEASVPPDRGPTEPAAHRAMTRPESAA